MKIIVTLNFVAGFLYAFAMVAYEKTQSEIFFLTSLLSFFSLGPLAVVNFVFIFGLWKRHRLRAFIPSATYVLSGVFAFLFMGYGTDFVLRNTPCRPDSFFNNQTKAELTDVAEHLVGNGFKKIITSPDKPVEVCMLTGHQKKDLDPKILAIMSKYGFIQADIDDCQEIVTFGYYHPRTWLNYTWAKNGLSEPNSMPSEITEVDIENWAELIRIAEQIEPTTQRRRESIEFEPSIVCPYLSAALGPEMLDRFRSYTSIKEFSDEDRKMVLEVLNRQRLATSALAENPQITYEKWKWHWQTETGLHIAKMYIIGGLGDGILKQLLSEGVLTLAPDGHHLKIKANLTDKQRLEVEWLHIEIMNVAYGNLLEKRQYPFRKKLGDSWYFGFR